MPYYLRKVSRSKWNVNLGLEPRFYTADAITGCNRTNNNTLSVWLSDTKEFEDESVQKLIVALAISMTEPASIDLLWLEPVWFEQKGIVIKNTPAKTRYTRVNTLHRDIAYLNHTLLADVGYHITQQLQVVENYKRMLKADLIALVYKWIKEDGDFTIEDLSIKWHEPLYEYAAKNS